MYRGDLAGARERIEAVRIGEGRSLLGASLLEQGRATEGRQLLAAARDALAESLGADDPRTRLATERLERAGRSSANDFLRKSSPS
jgi:hypothetical protein